MAPTEMDATSIRLAETKRLREENVRLCQRIRQLEAALLAYRQRGHPPELTDDEWVEQTLAMFADRASS